jgi:hypothetical protein
MNLHCSLRAVVDNYEADLMTRVTAMTSPVARVSERLGYRFFCEPHDTRGRFFLMIANREEPVASAMPLTYWELHAGGFYTRGLTPPARLLTCYDKSLSNLIRGMNKAMTMKPTIKPRTTTINGSNMLTRPSTSTATSSS